MDNRKVVKVVSSGFPQLVQRVNIYNSVLDKIREKHPEEFSPIDEVYSTIEGDATRIHKSRTNASAVVFVNDEATSTSGDPLRVPVKIYADGSGIMSTAHFTSSKDQGELLWSKANAKQD